MRIEPPRNVTFALLAAGLAACSTAPQPTAEDLRAWFAKPAASRGPAPETPSAMTRAEADAWRELVVAACRDAMRANGADDLVTASTTATDAQQGELRIGDFTMPYVLLQKGERPANGWPLWICLHGGGGNDQADGPHGWSVNTKEWDAQKRLFAKVYSGSGLYFIPRMADDRRGRWCSHACASAALHPGAQHQLARSHEHKSRRAPPAPSAARPRSDGSRATRGSSDRARRRST